MNFTMLWIAAIIVLVAIEMLTLGLTSIWFAVGALLALIASLFGAGISVQIGLFLIGSIAAILGIRPLATNFLKVGKERTNADQVIGKNAVVTQEIDNDAGQGLVKIGGQMWSARSEDGKHIGPGIEVVVLRISGVKVYVKPLASMKTTG